MATIQDLASQLFDAIESKTRDNGESFYALKSDAPEWTRDVVRDAHGDFLPEDWRYNAIHNAAAAIADADEDADLDDAGHEFADSHVDIYNGALTAWLATNLNRIAYCDDARDEFGAGETSGIINAIQLGQYAELRDVFGLVLQGLRDRADEVADEDDSED